MQCYRRVKEQPKTQWCVVVRAASYDHQILRPSKSVEEEAVIAARVHEHDLEVKNLRRGMVIFRS